MGHRRSRLAVFTLAACVLAAAACTGGGGGSAGATPEFCAAYDEFVAASQAGEGTAELGRVVELAPSGTEEHLELLLALFERTRQLDDGGFEGDLTGDMGSMQVIAQLRQPGPREAEQRLREVLVDDCGRPDLTDAEQPAITPFTSIAPLDD